jgi:CheY-like chemotaxis protein
MPPIACEISGSNRKYLQGKVENIFPAEGNASCLETSGRKKMPVAQRSNPVRSEVRHSKTVLVVEDEPLVCAATCEVLQDAGYRVIHAGTAAEAGEVLSSYGTNVDLLLCDAVLPDGNGIALSRKLRAEYPDMQTLLASGYPLATLFGEFRVLERQILPKPYSASHLLATVRRALVE